MPAVSTTSEYLSRRSPLGPLVACTAAALLFALSACTYQATGPSGERKNTNRLVSPELSFDEREAKLLEEESPANFRELLDRLDSADTLHPRKMAALDRRLEEWSDQTRSAPHEWVKRLAEGEALELMWYVRTVRVSNAEHLEQLASNRHIRHVTRLVVESDCDSVDPETAKAVADSPHFAQLEHLEFQRHKIRTEGAEALAHSEHLRRLEHLELPWSSIGDEGLRALTNSPNVRHLKRLLIEDTDVGPPGVRALARSPYLSKLQVLDLSSNYVTDEGARRLAHSSNSGRLTHLDLAWSNIGPAGVSHIADSEYSSNLTTLDLSENPVGADGIRALANSDALQGLRHLRLAHIEAEPTALASLADSDSLRDLEVLDLTGNETVDDLLQAVTRARHLGCDVVRFDRGCPPADEKTTEDDSETRLDPEQR